MSEASRTWKQLGIWVEDAGGSPGEERIEGTGLPLAPPVLSTIQGRVEGVKTVSSQTDPSMPSNQS